MLTIIDIKETKHDYKRLDTFYALESKELDKKTFHIKVIKGYFCNCK